MRKTLASIAVNGAAVALAWYGVHGNSYAWNVYRFMAWFSSFLWILILAGHVIKHQSITPRRKTQVIVSSLTDLTLAVMLSAFGHFGYAAMQVLQQGIEQMLYAKTQNGGN